MQFEFTEKTLIINYNKTSFRISRRGQGFMCILGNHSYSGYAKNMNDLLAYCEFHVCKTYTGNGIVLTVGEKEAIRQYAEKLLPSSTPRIQFI